MTPMTNGGTPILVRVSAILLGLIVLASTITMSLAAPAEAHPMRTWVHRSMGDGCLAGRALSTHGNNNVGYFESRSRVYHYMAGSVCYGPYKPMPEGHLGVQLQVMYRANGQDHHCLSSGLVKNTSVTATMTRAYRPSGTAPHCGTRLYFVRTLAHQKINAGNNEFYLRNDLHSFPDHG